MEINHLREFLMVAKLRSFSLAADELYITPSSLSKHIASLEKEIGVKLFNRTTRSVTVSKYGEILIPYATKIVEQEIAFREKIAIATKENENVLRIASFPMLAHYGITEILSSFRKMHPEINLQISEFEVSNIITYFSRNIFDVAFVGSGSIPKGSKYIEIRRHKFVAVLPEKHPLAKEKVLRLEQLRNEKFLFLNDNTTILQVCINACKKAGFIPEIVYTGNRPENILKFVSQGIGITLLMTPLVNFYNIPNLVCVDIQPSIISRVYLIWNEKQPLKPIVKKFLNSFTQNN